MRLCLARKDPPLRDLASGVEFAVRGRTQLRAHKMTPELRAKLLAGLKDGSIVPYLGPGVTAAATGMAAFMQFDSLSQALLVAGSSLAIATLVGTFVTTWMIGRIAGMNSAAIFIALLFWGWLWGIWGMLLSIPIIVIAKVVSEHVEELHPLSELLGD